jgi:hypothetical protein
MIKKRNAKNKNVIITASIFSPYGLNLIKYFYFLTSPPCPSPGRRGEQSVENYP